MRQRIKRVGWWFLRLRGKRLIGFVLIVGVAVLAGWLYGGFDSAAVGGVIALVLAGIVLARPLSVLAERVFLQTAPWRSETGSLAFADSDLGFQICGFVDKEASPGQQVETIAQQGGRFGSGEVSLELWLVASDQQGQHWTIVQEVQESAGRAIWTSSIDTELTMADFDDTGRPNPFRAIHRVTKNELDVPLVDIELLGWGRERLLSGTRDTLVAFVRTSVGAELLSGFEYPANRQDRHAHLVQLNLDGVAKALGWGHPSNWRGGSAFGLLELHEMFERGAWASLERRVAPRWYEKSMFARVERGTERISKRPVAAPH